MNADKGLPMRSIAGTALLLAAIGGCSFTPIEPVDPGISSATSRPPVELKSFDPPTRFDAAAVTPLEVSTDADEVLLHGTTAVVPIHGSKPTASSEDEIRLVDVRTNTVREVIKPTYPLPKIGTVTVLPALTSVGGRPTVLAPFLGESPGQGTTPGRPLVEVVAIDPESGKADWRAEIPVEGWPENGSANGVEVSVVGVADGVGIVRIADSSLSAEGGDTYALDLGSRKVLWSMRGFAGRAVAAGVVAGQQPGAGQTPKVQVRGIDARTGRQRWASPRDAYSVDVFAAGPSKAVVRGRTEPDGKRYVEVVEIATGRAVTVTEDKPDAPAPHPQDCVYDEQAITICSGNDWVGALDAQTGSWLWSITKGGSRLVPYVTGAWHGVVYGRTDNGPVVLDGRTGTDRETQPGVAPSVVNDSVAIGPWPGGNLGSSSYPVIG
ncbi:PQQ-binding-like beta-propeller repeat protein [Plantactinospora sonchi]|uniref:Pyrrolo-quinoline quinone n=1 Tax=Plantactinospora sonchi TaxID=1544735 RepID=A0ABU7RUE5_9ACTN